MRSDIIDSSKKTRSWPTVSVIISAYNEEKHIKEVVEALLIQDYKGSIEIIIALAPSTDRTREVVTTMEAEGFVQSIQNPSGRTATGLNLAFAVSSGEIIVRIDGHCIVDPGYVLTAVSTLNEVQADNVGGIMAAEGTTAFGRAVACAMRSWIGVGSATFHLGGKPGPVDTVYLGCFRREILERVNGYDERYIRAQDWELNYRIRRAGGVVWFTPDLVVTYRPRESFFKLAKQYFQYATYRRQIIRTDPSTATPRYLAAPLLVASVFISVVLYSFNSIFHFPPTKNIFFGFTIYEFPILLFPIYFLIVVVISFRIQRQSQNLLSKVLLPFVIVTMHLSWGIGFLLSRKKFY